MAFELTEISPEALLQLRLLAESEVSRNTGLKRSDVESESYRR